MCEERPRDVIIEVEYFTVPMIQRVVRELEYSDRPVYTYRIDDGDENNNDDNDDDVDNQDLLDFDIQFQFNYEKSVVISFPFAFSASRALSCSIIFFSPLSYSFYYSQLKNLNT